MKDTEAIISILRSLLEAAGIAHSAIEADEVAGQAILAIVSDDPALRDAQRHETARALDMLVKRIAEAKGLGRGGFIIDMSGVEAKRLRELEMRARMMAERARSFQYDVELAPMTPYERLIVHSVLSAEPSVATESRGEGRERRVVIKYVAQDPLD